MKASLLRIGIATATLLRQNRVLIALLLLWPFALSAILLISSHGQPSVDDAAAILQQELLYGLALVGLGASTALGTEQKARRTEQMLGRALGRAEYLLALGGSAYLPFLGYLAVWLVNVVVFNALVRPGLPSVAGLGAAAIVAGFLLASVGLFFSTWLPQFAALAASGISLGLTLAVGMRGWSGIWALFGAVAGEPGSRSVRFDGIAEGVSAGILLVWAASASFRRRDVL
jgi:hypothetical protein